MQCTVLEWNQLRTKWRVQIRRPLPAREGEQMKPRSFHMPFSPHLVVFLLPPENPYMKTTSGGSIAPFNVQIGPETTKNVVRNIPMIRAWNPSRAKALKEPICPWG